ncbi:trigger factor [Desulfohalotomaculum tongense]|uniref:trigger factor n=1 Tax=Desulforadius tongensis TaxID=1216062 RepID=UPI00195C2356|nr:trigger factor [Desulforadius tongensis]MBM7854550.1 trigger factor [Desulforadius tongensis]
MKATAEKLEKNEVMLEIEVDKEKFSQAVNRAAKKLARRVNIPGFRRGKAPKVLVERYVGKDALYQEAIEEIFPGVYQEAVKETEISPIAQPEVENIQAEEGEPLVFKLKVAVKPEVKLGQYKGFEIKKAPVEVTEEDVQKELENMQNRHAKLITLDEGELQDGDTAMIDFTGYVDGEEFEGGKAENYSLVIGSGTFIPGFEEQLIGLKVGEEKEVNVTFPEDYHAGELAGKEAVFKVKLNSIKRKELAPLDDEFAKDVSEFDTLEELKADLMNKLKEGKEHMADAAVSREAVEKAVENAQLEIPEAMIEQRLDEMIKNMESRLRSQGLGLEQYLQYTNSSIDELRDKMKDDAEKEVRRELVLDEIAKVENISVTDEELDKEIAEMAPQFRQEPGQLKLTLESMGSLEMVKEDILRRKIVKYLTEEANVIEEKAEENNSGTNEAVSE